MGTAPENVWGKAWLCSEDNHKHMATNIHTQTETHIDSTAIKACGLFKMAENQFNETKVNGCAILLLYFPFCYSRQEKERALS